MHLLHTDTTCASPTLTNGELPLLTSYNYTVDHRWIDQRVPDGWRALSDSDMAEQLP